MRYPPLNAQELRYLQQLQQRLKASGSERVKTSTKTVQQVLAWCVEYDLVPGNSLTLPQFSFNLALLNDIARVQRQLQQACYLDALSQNSRMDNAARSQQELKNIGAKPGPERVTGHRQFNSNQKTDQYLHCCPRQQGGLYHQEHH